MVKNVVILGMGLAGSKVATDLAAALPTTHRVIVVSESSFGFFPPASLRSAVVSGWEDKSTVPLDTFFPKGSRHIVLPGTKVLAMGKKSVRVDKQFTVHNLDYDIPFDYAVIATGSTYAFPCRPPTGARTRDEVTAAFKIIQQDVKAASSVLVVGGGATGVEFAGEVAQTYPNTKVSLAHSHATLFDNGWKPKLGQNLAQQLGALGVHLYFNSYVETGSLKSGPIERTRFRLGGGREVEADYLLLATGGSPNSQIFDRHLVDAKGLIKVRPTLQLEDAAYSNVFALGDVCNLPEGKMAVSIGNQAPVLVANLVASIKKGSSAPLKNYKVATSPMGLITTGSNGGSGQVMGFVLGSFFARMLKSKDLMIPMFQKGYGYKA